jgi:ArsR family transcriptional regulator, arsenate/arsenite/antimonite-responsive transcriptional repressor
MDSAAAIEALKALAQDTRLAAYRALAGEKDGVAAGDLAGRLGVPQNTLSTHLAILANAGLVESERQSRSVIYRANLGRLEELMVFLAQDCCGGNPALCIPFLSKLNTLTEKKDCC